MPASEARKLYSQMIEELVYEYGNDTYSGELSTKNGVQMLDKVFKTEREAYQYIDDNSSSSDPAIAVKVGDFAKSACNSKSGLELLAKIAVLRKTLDNWAGDWLAGRKSAFIGCPSCESKLSRKYLANHVGREATGLKFVRNRAQLCCPLCFTGLMPETELKRASAAQAKLSKLVADFDKLVDKDSAKGLFWLVGGWCRE